MQCNAKSPKKRLNYLSDSMKPLIPQPPSYMNNVRVLFSYTLLFDMNKSVYS